MRGFCYSLRHVVWGLALALTLALTSAAAPFLVVNWGGDYVTANATLQGLLNDSTQNYNSNPTADGRRWIPFSESTPMSPASGYSGQTFYGGANSIAYDGANPNANFRINNATPDVIQFPVGRNSSWTGEAAFVVVWLKQDFLANSTETLCLTSDCTLTITNTAAQFGTHRLVVKDGSQYYVSESSLTGPGHLTVPDPTAVRWATFNPANGDNRLTEILADYAFRSFNDVRALGYYWSCPAGTSDTVVRNILEQDAEFMAEVLVVGGPPVVTNVNKNVTINMDEDGAPTAWPATPPTIGATDPDGDTLSWTNGAIGPSNGTVAAISVSDSSNLTAYTYTPNTNFNGTNTFTVMVKDPGGSSDSCTVTVVVAAINDPPTNTAAPVLLSAGYLYDVEWTNTDGTWSDNVDTNASYTHANFTNNATFTYQWQYSNGVGGVDIADATNNTFTPNGYVDTNLRVVVTCVDNGYPDNATGTAVSAWQQVYGASVPPPVITNGPGPLAWTIDEDCGETNLQSVLSLAATNGGVDTLTWSVVAPGATQGVASVSGGTASPSSPTTFTYQPANNANGADSFEVVVTGIGGSDTVRVDVTINAINDPPVCTVTQVVSGVRLVGSNLTVNTGTWNDNADTNAVYTALNPTFTYQWQRADNGAGDGETNIAGATTSSYTLQLADKYKFIRTAVTCTDDNYGSGGNQSNTAYSTWLQETSTVPTVVAFNKASDNWGAYTNWTPDSVPTTNITAFIGDTGVLRSAEALIDSGANFTKDLYLGTNANSKGTLTMTGGTLTGNGGLYAGNGVSSTGIVNQTGGALYRYTDLQIARGTNSVGSLFMSGSSAITSILAIASAPGADGTLTLTNATWKNGTGNTAREVGGASNAVGRLYVRGTAIFDLANPTTARGLTLGTVANSTGIVEVTGSGLITNVSVLTVGSLGYGRLDVKGSGQVRPSGANTSMPIGGAGGAGEMLVADDAVVYGRPLIGAGAGSTGTLTLTNSAKLYNYGTADINVGDATNATGTLAVRQTAIFDMNTEGLTLGAAAGSTGIVDMAGGMITNLKALAVGSLGYGRMTVGGAAIVYPDTVNVCGTNNSSEMQIRDSGSVVVKNATKVGAAEGSAGTLTLTNSSLFACGNAVDTLQIGATNNALGVVKVVGGTLSSANSSRFVKLGLYAGSTGRLALAGGVYTNAGTTIVGSAAGGLGTVQVTGGMWRQAGALSLGGVAGATGLVTVADTTQTDITGATTVGAGGYGLLTISNATFGGSTAITVGSGGTSLGRVELVGSGSVLRCSTLTVTNGGFVTNHMAYASGGIDITNTASTALTITNGNLYLSFEHDKVGGGSFWGLRWAGSHSNDLQTLKNAGGLAWDDAGVSPKAVSIFTNATHTFVGYYTNTPPDITNGVGPLPVTMDEDGSPTSWNAAKPNLGAIDLDDDPLIWGLKTAPTQGMATVNGTGAAPANFSYAPATNYYGSDSFVVQVTDGSATDTIVIAVSVSPRNDAPVNTASPTVSPPSQFQVGRTVTNISLGVYNDGADTNAPLTGSSTLTLSRLWQRSATNDGTGITDLGTAQTYNLTAADSNQYVRVRVVCTDDGVGTPASQSTTNSTSWQLVTRLNAPPAVDTSDPQPVSISEDTAWGPLTQIITATDPEGDPMTWSLLSGPSHGNATVTGTATNSPTITYTPATNWNGGDSFVVQVADNALLTDTVRVDVTVSPVNDAPTNVVLPTVGGTLKVNKTLTAGNGTWSDAIDTNVSGSSTFSFTYQWRRADTGAGAGDAPISLATNQSYTLTATDSGKYVRVAVTCTDDGVGSGGAQSNSANSAWNGPVAAAAAVFNAVTSGRFNASDVDTWGQGANVYPGVEDEANIATYTVNTRSAGEVTTGVTVNVSGGGTLLCSDTGASLTNAVDASATVNVNAGGTLLMGSNNVLGCTVVLDGGKLTQWTSAELSTGSVLRVQSDSELAAAAPDERIHILSAVHGAGKLTVTGEPDSYGSGVHLSFRTNSTWSGAWDIQSGNVRIPGQGGTQASLPGDLRIAAGATVQHYSVLPIRGTLSGAGRSEVSQSETLPIGDGTGNGVLSPGDPGAPATFRFESLNNNKTPVFQFNANSTFMVDIQGSGGASYTNDQLLATDRGTGTGIVQIASGATLKVTLWNPLTNNPSGPRPQINLNAKIIDTRVGDAGGGGDGVLTGSFASTIWSNAAGWQNLTVTKISNDLVVTGSYPASPTAIILH